MYDHNHQYQCTIIRARAIRKMDDLLPKYARVITEVCPCKEEDFKAAFDEAFKEEATSHAHDPNNLKAIQKTLDNHRTEVSGKLFGMHYTVDKIVYASERTRKLIEDDDQPAFFKDICYKMQFPNSMQSSSTYLKRINDKICIRPYAFLLKFLLLVKAAELKITKDEIGYYVLNSMDVLQGIATPSEVLAQFRQDKEDGIPARRIVIPADASISYDQHIGDQLRYIELANLIILNQEYVEINPNEYKTVCFFALSWENPPEFDMYKYEVATVAGRKLLQNDWNIYFSQISNCSDMFTTTSAALGIPQQTQPAEIEKSQKENWVEFGDEGEKLVYEYEKERVRAFEKRLANKVIHLGKTKGLGYDIQSVIAEEGDMAEFVKYIEVKSTKRVTEPDINDKTWIDTLNITRNEWVAAQQHKSFYAIYRVYFVRGTVIMYVLQNVCQKVEDKLLKMVPMTYRVDFGSTAVDFTIPKKA